MAQILVRKLDDRVVEALKRRAKAAGVSLEQTAREALTQAVRGPGNEVWEAISRFRASARPGDASGLIREWRDHGRADR